MSVASKKMMQGRAGSAGGGGAGIFSVTDTTNPAGGTIVWEHDDHAQYSISYTDGRQGVRMSSSFEALSDSGNSETFKMNFNKVDPSNDSDNRYTIGAGYFQSSANSDEGHFLILDFDQGTTSLLSHGTYTQDASTMVPGKFGNYLAYGNANKQFQAYGNTSTTYSNWLNTPDYGNSINSNYQGRDGTGYVLNYNGQWLKETGSGSMSSQNTFSHDYGFNNRYFSFLGIAHDKVWAWDAQKVNYQSIDPSDAFSLTAIEARQRLCYYYYNEYNTWYHSRIDTMGNLPRFSYSSQCDRYEVLHLASDGTIDSTTVYADYATGLALWHGSGVGTPIGGDANECYFGSGNKINKVTSGQTWSQYETVHEITVEPNETIVWQGLDKAFAVKKEIGGPGVPKTTIKKLF
jgi:hypothetical protein